MRIVAGVIVLAVAGAGCGASVEDRCLELCEQQEEECGGLGSNCAASCDEAGETAAELGCESEALDLYDCIDENGVCSENSLDECDTELGALFSCSFEYCIENPDSEPCEGVDDG